MDTAGGYSSEIRPPVSPDGAERRRLGRGKCTHTSGKDRQPQGEKDSPRVLFGSPSRPFDREIGVPLWEGVKDPSLWDRGMYPNFQTTI